MSCYRTAIHESGHACVGLLRFSGIVEVASIEPKADTDGRVSFGRDKALLGEDTLAMAIVFSARAAAEKHFFGSAGAGCSDDLQKVKALCRDALMQEEVEILARVDVTQNEAWIKRVADALLRKKRLTAFEISRLRSES